MMKKIFAVFMVLCLCGTASAVIISLEGEGTPISAVPGLVTINILATPEPGGNPGLLALDAIITVTGGDVIVDALSIATAAAYGWDPSLSFDPLGLGTASVEAGVGTFGAPPSGVVGFVEVAYTGGTQIVSIAESTMCVGTGIPPCCSRESDGYTCPTFSTGVVTIIPEPATIALLGLGGLALLRRRK